MVNTNLSPLTFRAEGSQDEETLYWHWPGGNSGPTLGKGTDFSANTQETLRFWFSQAGIPWASVHSAALGLKSKEAEAFCESHKGHKYLHLTEQIALFNAVWLSQEEEVTRICTHNVSVLNAYGDTDVAGLKAHNPALWLLAVDLKFVGHYHPGTRPRFQPLLVSNSAHRDSTLLRDLMSDEDFWMGGVNVAPGRFQLRKTFVEEHYGN